MNTYHRFTALDSIGRACTFHADPTRPQFRGQVMLSLDKDPGTGSMTSSQQVALVIITGGPREGLQALLDWVGTLTVRYGYHDRFEQSIRELLN